MEATSDRTFVFECNIVVKMKQDCADVPYINEKGPVTAWYFSLAYDTMESFMPIAQAQLAASRLPVDDSEEILKVQLKHNLCLPTPSCAIILGVVMIVALNCLELIDLCPFHALFPL